MGWNACNTTPTTDLTVTAGQASGINLTVFETGGDDQALAYRTQILYANATTKTVPDAWRFDPNGCQGASLVTLNHLPPALLSKSCPAFRDAGGAHTSLEIKTLNFEPAGFPYPTSVIRIDVAVALTNGGVIAPVAATHYFLSDAEFNETFGVTGAGDPPNTCGGLDIPVCFNLNSASYIINDGSNAEIFMNIHTGADGDWATANAGGAGGCQNTPAQTRTWGQIKNQYRN